MNKLETILKKSEGKADAAVEIGTNSEPTGEEMMRPIDVDMSEAKNKTELDLAAGAFTAETSSHDRSRSFRGEGKPLEVSEAEQQELEEEEI